MVLSEVCCHAVVSSRLDNAGLRFTAAAICMGKSVFPLSKLHDEGHLRSCCRLQHSHAQPAHGHRAGYLLRNAAARHPADLVGAGPVGDDGVSRPVHDRAAPALLLHDAIESCSKEACCAHDAEWPRIAVR